MFNLFFIPHIIALSITIQVAYYAWKQSTNWGMRLFAWYISGYLVWIVALIFELNNPNLQIKILWDTVQWGICILVTPAIPAFSLLYTQKEIKNKYRQIYKALLNVALVLLVLIFTDNVHGLLYTALQIIYQGGLHQLFIQPSLLRYALLAYIYGMLLWGIVILIQHYLHTKKTNPRQTLFFILGFTLPAAGALLDIMSSLPLMSQSVAPIAIAVGNVFNLWSLKDNIFLITPTNRHEAFEAMMDPVVILDNNNRVIDINRSMLDLLGTQAKDVIGHQAKEIFDNFPIPIKLYSSVSYARAEAEFEISGQTVHYEMSVWPILNANNSIISRLYISHDITALKELEKELRRLNDKLEARVRERTQELGDSYNYTLEGWAKALELRDKETEGHSRRVTETTVKVARAYDIPEEELEHIRRGAILHDIGKMAISDQVLLKPGKLTEDERRIIKMHPIIAYNLLKDIPFLHQAIEIPYSHHERWDGDGYPQGLRGKEIPLAARIFAVVDVWDALRSDRPYRDGWSKEKVIAHLVENANKHFDAKVVNVFLDLIEKGEIE